MKILVAIRTVIDHNTALRFKADGSGIDANHLKMIINPFDEIALEEAIRLKESKIASEVIAIAIGDNKAEKNLRNALAMGADRGILIEFDAKNEPANINYDNTIPTQNINSLNTAKILKYFALRDQVDVIMIGKQSVDNNNCQVGQMTSALLGWSQATFASAVVFEDNPKPSFVIVARETDYGVETIKVKLPTVITTDLRMNIPRFIAISNLLKAKNKPVEKIAIGKLEELNVDLLEHFKVTSIKAAPQRTAGKQLNSVQELSKILKEHLP